MLIFKRHRPEVLEKWHAFFDNFEMSSLVFYQRVREELTARKVPGLTMSEVKWREGGVLSDERRYLRLTRERWVFDICAAPFGRGYLFSYRFTELPIRISLIVLLFVLSFFATIPFVFWFILQLFLGFILSTQITVGVCSGFLLIGLVLAIMNPLGVDFVLLRIPAIGPFYDRFIRENTYYREDTRLMYLATVPAVIKMITEEVTVSKGVKQPAPAEAKPILKELAGIT